MEKHRNHLGRRNFLAAAATGGVGLALQPGAVAQTPAGGKSGKRRVVLVGTGIRGISLWGKTLKKNYSDVVEFVGLCDTNPKRMAFARDYIGLECPMFSDKQFEEMIRKTSPDQVIVTTVDCFHSKYICRAMELGLDVISEKPLATDEKMIEDIMETTRRTGRKLTVTHNYRFGPDAERIKRILETEEIGTITSVDFNYYLDTDHGTSYFRRWHAYKQNNGSLLVHKSCHHFDLANWWLGAEPAEVQAFGSLRRFGYNGPFRNARCMGCPHKDPCEWYLDITKDELAMNLYVKPESEDGYLRDACVYRRDINVWDTQTVNVRYHSGVLMTYSLNCFMPYEGFKVSFNGTKGRLDARVYHAQPWKVDVLADIRITPLFKESRTETVGSGGGGHWGADTKMQDLIFRGPRPDPLNQAATPRQAALACLIGIAGRRSIEQGRPVFIEELAKL